jgi:hypothetical protein
MTGEERLAVYRRYVELALEHWGSDAHGRSRAVEFVRWHVGFWCRYAPRRPDGSWPGMQEREPGGFARTPLEALLTRQDEAAHAWLAERLMAQEPIDPEAAPPPGGPEERPMAEPEG